MSKRLTEQDFQIAAKKLKAEVAAIKAVAQVESRGEGFYSDGFPVILFERHKFRQFTKGKFNNSHPHLSGAAGGYGKAGQNQRNKFNEAFALDPIAAMKSCSWGKFQIMGFNHAVCGFGTVGEFVDAMKESEGAQLLAFVNFVINNGLADELRNKNWAGFARGYNGAGYRKNAYDTKMASAYKRFNNGFQPSAANFSPIENQTDHLTPPIQNSGEDESSGNTEISQNPPDTTKVSVTDGNVKVETSSTEAEPQKVAIEKPEPKGFIAKIKAELSVLTGGNLTFQGFVDYFNQIQLFGLSSRFWTIAGAIVGLGSAIYILMRYLKHREEEKRDAQITENLVKANTTDNNKVALVSTDEIEEYKKRGYQIVHR